MRAFWNSSLGGPLTTLDATGALALGTGAALGLGASPPLYSERHVCMSFVTVLSPDAALPFAASAALRSSSAGPDISWRGVWVTCFRFFFFF